MKQESMTSRQRVLAAINHQAVDRYPIDLGAHFSTGISGFAYKNLREYLQLPSDNIEMIDCVQGLARIDDDIAARFHLDTVLLNPPWQQPQWWEPRENFKFKVSPNFQPVRQSDGSFVVEYGKEKLYMPAGGFFFDGGWPDFYGLSENERIAVFAARAEKLFKETDKFTIMMGFPGYFGGIEFACDMLTDPEACKAENEALLQKTIAYFDKVNHAMGKYIGAVEVNSDLGMQSAPMCSPDSYEECVLPYLKQFCAHVHKTSNIKVFIHSCGSIYKLLPHLVEAGIDVLNPVQISAADMNPARLKREFGDKLCFWGGGCDTQMVLWSKTPADVVVHALQNINAFKPNSGFVFTQVHNIMGNVPPENIVALFDTAYENSFYE